MKQVKYSIISSKKRNIQYDRNLARLKDNYNYYDRID